MSQIIFFRLVFEYMISLYISNEFISV